MDASIYQLRHRDVLLFCVLGLLSLGVVMVQSASSSLGNSASHGWSQVGEKHLAFATAAFVTFLLIGHFDYAKLNRPAPSLWHSPLVWVLAIAALTCVLVLVPGVGMRINGARRWLKLGPLVLQPSELAKWSMVVFLSWWLTSVPIDFDRFFKGFLLTLLPVGMVCLLVVMQDFGTAALIGLCALTMMLAGRIQFRHIALVLLPVAAAAAGFVAHEPYRMKRVLSFLDPYAAPQGAGYHMIQSLLSFSTGGLTGRGLGNGIQKLGYLPEDTTDFIFAVVCEELGLFGALLTVALYLGVIYVGWQVVRQKRDDFGRMLAFGVASMVGLQAVINIAVATVSVPPKGLSLPLISAGGSGLVITSAALGLLYSVTRFEHGVVKPSDCG